MKKFNKIIATGFILFIIAHCTFFIDNCRADWIQMNGPKGATVNCIASSGNFTFAGTEGAGVFYSANNGISWINSGTGWTSPDVHALFVNGSFIFAGTDFGVYISTNNGLNWSPRDSMPMSVISFAASGSYLFKGTENYGVFRSINNGASWISASSGLNSSYINTLSVSENNLYAGTGQGVFLSTNNGSNWVQFGLPNYNVRAISKIGTKIFAGTQGEGILMSSNNGTNWVTYSFGLQNPYVSDFETSGNDLYAGTEDGVFKLLSGGSMWNEVSTGLTHNKVLSLLFAGTNLFAGTYGGGIFLSDNFGSLWTPLNAGLMYYYLDVTVTAVYGTNIFAGTFQDGVQLSTDNGSSWNAVNNGLTHSRSILSLAISGPNIFAGTGTYFGNGGLFISTNNGANWLLQDLLIKA
jgi:hypothetical protein